MRTVDIELDTDVWIGVPGEWTDETFSDHRDWAREVAEIVWNGVPPRPGEEGPDHLALTLAMVAESPLMEDPARRAFLWLPGPSSEVLPVYLEAFAAEGDRDDALRELTLADAPGAVEPPIVEPFVTDLGEGLRVLRYASDPEDGAVVLTLSFAWRAEDLDVRLWLSSFDTGLALRAMDDVDDLARAVRLVDL
jgi:hypothetical protein